MALGASAGSGRDAETATAGVVIAGELLTVDELHDLGMALLEAADRLEAHREG